MLYYATIFQLDTRKKSTSSVQYFAMPLCSEACHSTSWCSRNVFKMVLYRYQRQIYVKLWNVINEWNYETGWISSLGPFYGSIFLSSWLIIMFSKFTTANFVWKHQINVMSANGTWISLSLQQFFYSPYINENLNWLIPKLNHMIWNRIIICILIWFPPSWIIMLQQWPRKRNWIWFITN